MENNDIQTPVTSVALKSLDEVEHDAQQTGVADKPADAASSQAREEATNHEDSGVPKEELVQAKDSVEAQSEPRDTAPAEAKTVGAAQSYVPPVKRFSAVNINKKFLQKNQSSTGAGGGTSSGSSSSKQAGVIARPAPQSAHSHSRLVTAKLTAAPLSSSAGQGWSRPNSVTPPAPSPANAPGPTKGLASAVAPVGGPPHIAPGGKIIQPQVLKQKVDGPGRPAWRSVQPGAINSGLQTQNEFPTAAEAAQSRLLKLADMKAAADVSDAQKQAMSETADAFRGVHLDPNAHHWDEMEEEDNDDFLGDVIEFGDGRQYTIQVSGGTKVDPKALEDRSGNPSSEGPVSKTERFVDDFDRSWPKSRQEQGAHPFFDGHGAHKDESIHHGPTTRSETSSNLSGHSPVSVRDGSQSRVLFNDRLNRMEPISGSRPPSSSHVPAYGAAIHRDGQDGSSRFHNNRMERDVPPHSAFTNTRKPHDPSWNVPLGLEQHTREIREMKSESPTSYFHGEHHDRKGRTEWASNTSHSGPPPSGRPFGSREPSTSRSTVNGAPSVASSDDQGSRHGPTIRDQHRGHFPQSGHHGDMDRQLPPHPIHSRSTFPSERSSAEAYSHNAGLRVPSDVPSESTPAKDHDQPQSTRLAQTQSDVTVPKTTSSIPPDGVEALRKAFLADNAERAKKRRQQEEEERLKAQERARKKAAELEVKMVAAKATEEVKATPEPTPNPAVDVITTTSTVEVSMSKPTEAEVVKIIEEAINSAVPSEITPRGMTSESGGKETVVSRSSSSSFAKALSHGDHDHAPVASEAQESVQVKRPPTATSDRADSWRAKPKPPVLPVQNSKNDISHESVMAALPAVRAFELQADESMEVIDFSDMGRLVGERTLPKSVTEANSPSSRPARAVASDFFRGSVADKPEQESWRKVNAISNQSYSAAAESGLAHDSHQNSSVSLPDTKAVPHVNEDVAGHHANTHVHSKMPLSPTNGFSPQLAPNHSGHPPTSPGVARFLRLPNASYREAPLSALDDTMSRIKGALDVMHSVAEHEGKGDKKDNDSSSNVPSTAPASGPSKPNKWLPPALRPPGAELNHRRVETFEFTRPEPPRSPVPPDSSFAIRLPTVSRRVEPLTKKQINHQKHIGPVRWEILSFDPPVEGMTKKSLLVNDVLFRKPQGPYKSRKYRVLLPKPNTALRSLPGNGSQKAVSDTNTSGDSSKNVANGPFGRSRSELSNWRSTSASARVEGVGNSDKFVAPTLDITSRSPPPELASAVKNVRPPAVSRAASKPRSSQISLDGTDVAFYRDVRKHTESNSGVPSVTFTVGSELEGQSDMSPLRKTPVLPAETGRPSHIGVSEPTAPIVNAVSLAYTEPLTAPSVSSGNVELPYSSPAPAVQPVNQAGIDDKAFEQQNGPFLQRQPLTPPPQNTPSTWGKSPARAPDPEHLKAVWSQASNNASLPTVNSLKSIADDLTAVPFTLQEVKSEGGTPPPPPGPVAPPTRMSASEVTRAFQTVPTGPSNSMPSTSLRSNQMPPNLGSPIGSQRPLKPPSIGLPPPPSMNPNASRPPYMGYPTSMNNHSPSPPTLIYSHVMPNGMGASPSASPYGPPVWMPLVQQGPQILRAQPSSPYSPSLMPYPMPGGQNGMFSPSNGMPNPQGSPATYPSAPLPTQMMVSPVLPHASPAAPHVMYPGSPMLVHVPPPGGTPQPRAYPPGVVGMGRGSVPVQNPMDPRSHLPPGPPSAPASRFPVHNPGYTPVPQSFVRPW